MSAPSSRIRGSATVATSIRTCSALRFMFAQQDTHDVESFDDTALDALVDVVAVEILVAVGLQQPVKPRRMRAALGMSAMSEMFAICRPM